MSRNHTLHPCLECGHPVSMGIKRCSDCHKLVQHRETADFKAMMIVANAYADGIMLGGDFFDVGIIPFEVE